MKGEKSNVPVEWDVMICPHCLKVFRADKDGRKLHELSFTEQVWMPNELHREVMKAWTWLKLRQMQG